MSDLGLGQGLGHEVGFEVPMAFSTIEEEIEAGGWTRDTKPTGATPPPRAITAGSRGESQMDNDVYPTQFDKSGYSEC